MSNLIRSASLNGFEGLVRSQLANPIEILNRCNIHPAQLRDPENLINYHSCMEALELASKETNNPIFGLTLAGQQGLSMLGLVGAYMAKQSSVQEALAVAQKFAYVHSNAIKIQINILDDEFCEIQMLNDWTTYVAYPQKVQLSLGVFYRLLSDLIGSEFRPSKVSFVQHIDKSYEKQFSAFFNCPVQFGAQANTLKIHKRFLQFLPAYQSSLIDKVVIERFEAAHPNGYSFIEQVTMTISGLLSTGDCDKNSVALCLNMHPKRFQRALAKEGKTFRDLLQIVRKEHALKLMCDKQMTLLTIALNLGYADYSIFSRRFKQWFGKSPKDYREENCP